MSATMLSCLSSYLFVASQSAALARTLGKRAFRPLRSTLPDLWAGRDFGAGGTHLQTYNFTPTIAYKLNDMISVGLGFQMQYADATFTTGYGAFPTWQTSVDGGGWGYGFTAGITLTPTPTTDDRHRLSLRHQPEDQWHSVPAAGGSVRIFDAGLGQHHAQSARHRQHWLAAEAVAAMDGLGDG